MLVFRDQSLREFLGRAVILISPKPVCGYHNICHGMRVLSAVVFAADAVFLFIDVKIFNHVGIHFFLSRQSSAASDAIISLSFQPSAK